MQLSNFDSPYSDDLFVLKDSLYNTSLSCCRPPEFAVKESNPDEGIPADMLPPSDDEDEEGELTVVNANRRQIAMYEESEEESEEDEEER